MWTKPFAGLRAVAVAVGAIIAVLAAPLAWGAAELAMLGKLSKGAWEVRVRGEDSVSRICLRSGREIIQLRHQANKCSQFVVDDTPGKVTVQYTCPGNGYGITTVRYESSQLVQLESQGIVGGMPFDFRAEARRVGPC